MKKEDIKRHLKTYSIYDKRRTTINHAFASSIAPSNNYDENSINEALRFLNQNPNEDLTCVFCEKEAETWDHLIGLVKNGELRGFGHQIGNLVPCCKKCNSKKGSKEFERFINEHGGNGGNGSISKNELIKLLTEYQKKFAKKISLETLKNKNHKEYKRFLRIKKDIFDLMIQADEVAEELRKNILS